MQIQKNDQQYSFSTIKAPISKELVSKYAGIRLDALKLDSFAFTATYAEESRFTDNQWRSLLEVTDKITVIAHTGTSLLDQDAMWAAVGNLLTPVYLESQGWKIPYKFLGLDEEETAAYMLEGFWTRPEHRGRGLAGNMLRAVVEVIKEHKGDRRKTRVLTLQVHPDNQAQTVYERFGFVKKGIWEDDPIQEDWMLIVVV